MKLLRRLRLFVVFILFYFWELTRSNLYVAMDVIVPKAYYKPGMITISIEALSDYQAVLLANLITMTPGTICVDYNATTKDLDVHLMYLNEEKDIVKKIREFYVPFVRELMP